MQSASCLVNRSEQPRHMMVGKTLRGTVWGNSDDAVRTASVSRRLVDRAASCEVGEGEHHE